MGRGAKPWCEKHRCLKKWLKNQKRFKCRKCESQFSKLYSQKHRAEISAYDRLYRQKHRAEVNDRAKNSYHAHKTLPLRVAKLFQLINAVSTLTKENTTNENTNISIAVNSQ